MLTLPRRTSPKEVNWFGREEAAGARERTSARRCERTDPVTTLQAEAGHSLLFSEPTALSATCNVTRASIQTVILLCNYEIRCQVVNVAAGKRKMLTRKAGLDWGEIVLKGPGP